MVEKPGFCWRSTVANHKQAEKRNRQRVKRQANNRQQRSTMRTFVKRVRAAIAENDKAGALAALKDATPLIDRAGRRGIIPRGRATRSLSRLTQAVAKI
jgi:small subunit ribosomal protein S20